MDIQNIIQILQLYKDYQLRPITLCKDHLGVQLYLFRGILGSWEILKNLTQKAQILDRSTQKATNNINSTLHIKLGLTQVQRPSVG